MNNLTWYKGAELRKFLQSLNRNTSATEFLVAAFLQAKQDNLDLDELKLRLDQIAAYPSNAPKFDSKKSIKELGY